MMATGAPVRKQKPKIKPPRTHIQSQATIEETWKAFAKAVTEIHNNNAHRLSYEENYRHAYNLCLYRHGKMLYDGVCALIKDNLVRMARERIIPTFPTGGQDDPVYQSQEGERLLKSFRAVWDQHISSMSKLGDLLKYMDRTYVPNNNCVPVYQAGLDLFVKDLLHGNIQNTVARVILNFIRIERDGYTVNRSAVKSCVDVFLELGNPNLYRLFLEPQVLRESEDFYLKEQKALLRDGNASVYLQRVGSRLVEEETRCVHYLSSNTHPKVREIIYNKLVTPSLTGILHMGSTGLDTMINESRSEDMSRLYKVFTLVPEGLPALKKELKLAVEIRGNLINQLSEDADQQQAEADTRQIAQGKTSNAIKWVQGVLDLRDRFMSILAESFDSDPSVEESIGEAFDSFINRNSRAPEYISLFIDEHLKKGLKGMTDLEVESVLEKTIFIFRYITDKDVFERYYKSHLAKRLLHGRSVSDDAERNMLAKLKVECGHQFTQKMEGMFNDMRVSADTTEAYKNYPRNPHLIELSVIVMTATFWPTPAVATPCIFPPQLQQATKAFEGFYLSRHSGRKLSWQPTLGNADLKIQFKARKHDVNVPTMGMVVLLLFEDLDDDVRLSYKDIQSATDIPDNELGRALQSLACAKFKVLKKHPPSREVDHSDEFSFNHEFSAPLQKIKLGLVTTRVETKEQRRDTQERVEEERRLATEACIVRIMKDRKMMKHNDLVTEVTKQLAPRFQPQPIEIKKRIESLIEKEFLDRDEEDKRSYKYLA